jgi:CBS domain-containing protein
VHTVSPDTTIADLLRKLAEYNVGALVVSSNGFAVSGIVSERDVVRAMCTVGAVLVERSIDAIMTSDVIVATPEDPLESVMLAMTERDIRHVPVVSGGQLVGIISIGDVLRSRMAELESERERLIGYINAG